jgi:hypothetical protein
MANEATKRLRRWISYAACAWAVLFAAPHTWWALGIPAGFPGGEERYHLFMSSYWLYFYNLMVIVLSAGAVIITLYLLRPPDQIPRRWVPRTAAWIASGALTLRGLAGLAVDGFSDPIWWPTFLVGGILLGGVAWLARTPGSKAATPCSR